MPLTPILASAATLRKKVHDKVTSALTDVFPLDLKGRKLELSDVHVLSKEYSPDEEKHAQLTGLSLNEAVKGTLTLRDASGRVVDTTKNFTLAHIPYLTARHTLIADGNEYQVANQVRRKPGVYTQRADNGEIHTVFNLGRGANFDLGFNEAKGTFAIQYGASNLPLYPALRGLGLTHEQITEKLGKGVADANAKLHGHQVGTVINKLYQKLEHPALINPAATQEQKIEAIRKSYNRTTLDPEVTQFTLGKAHDKVTPEAMLDAAQKILAVHRGEQLPDDTDSLTFKTFHALDDFLGERIRLTARAWAPKAKMALNGKSSIREALRPAPFSDTIRKFITTSSLTAVPTGINPLELLDHSVKVTSMGEGGIPSDRAIPFDARMIHNTHFGVLDPIRTPESFSSGVDIRATIAAHRDEKGNLYTLMHNVKTGKDEFVKAGDLPKNVVAFPHQKLVGTVDAFVDGKQVRVSAGDVTHQLNHVGHLYSPATQMLPFIHNMQGNRAIMGSKMGTQALPLIEREEPLVQVKSHLPGEVSYETVYGRMVEPRATVSGVIKKIGDGWIHIQPHKEKNAADRAVVKTRTMGPFTFNIEIPKGATKIRGKDIDPNPLDYGHLPGYQGPDGDSLDFFVGTDPEGGLLCYEKQKRSSEDAPWKTTDVKFVVGPDTEEKKGLSKFLRDTTNEKVRYTKPTLFKDWDDLKKHISAYQISEEKTAAQPELVRVPYQTYFPFPSKTYLHHDLTVKVGDKVREGQSLGGSNFTRNGALALGKNLLVGYIPYYGYNSNDATVISEACAKKLTSEHMYREIYPLSSLVETGREKHRMYYGTKYTQSQYAHLDETGVVKQGAKVDPKDLLVVGLTKATIQGTDALLGRIAKSLAKPYKEVVLAWDHGVPGEVIDVVRSNGQIAILIKTKEQMQVGDKLAGRYGNKGVVAKIVPDHEMLRDESGKPLDVLLTSAGVVSRTNPSQILETAVSKVAEKTGKPLLYDNSAGIDAVQWATDLLKRHGVKDKETLYDPVLQRSIKGGDGKGVMVGKQYIYKLFKSTDTNFAGHGVGPYDLNEQPLKTGGDDSAKGIGKMEFDALLAHNARHFLREAATVRGQKNEEFWKAVQTGLPLPAAKPSFAYNKFIGLLEGAGIKVDKRGSKIHLLPLTDKDVLARSAGAIEHNGTLQAKDLMPEKGGLFDPRKTGGPQGTLYSHIELHEPMPSPVFQEPVRRLLGFTEKEFEHHLGEKGGAWFHQQLAKINVPKRLGELRDSLKKVNGPELNNVVKQVKYLETLQAHKLSPQAAYMITKVPVVPPMFRPILPQPNDPSQLMVSDANKLYAQLMDSNHTLKTTAVESDVGKHRRDLFGKLEELYGTKLTEDPKLQQQQVKGFLASVAGVGTPKGGFFQRKLMKRTQDVSGRGTAVPDANLGMDEVGIPEQMLWQMLDKLIVARLVAKGYPALDAREMVNKKVPAAREAMLDESRNRPVLMNRAPTLHRWNIIAAYAKPVQGKTIRVSPFIEKGANLDYDGDTLQIHTPITPSAVEEAKLMTMSNLLMADQQRNRIMAFPQHEAIIGYALASKAKSTKGAAKKFKTREDALSAYRRGMVQLSDEIEIEHSKQAEATENETVEPVDADEALSLFPLEHVLG